VAQVLDYGSWVSALDRDAVIDLANEHLDVPFESAFEDVFGTSAPDELNAALQLTIVATDLDASSERIVTYLRTFGVPVNAVFFSYLEDDDRRYLARSWLAREDESEAGAPTNTTTRRGKRAEWNGRDWFVSFGAYSGGRVWEDGRKYGFVSAGGDLVTRGEVDVALPRGGAVRLHAGGLATSGRTKRRWLRGGEERDHRHRAALRREEGRRRRRDQEDRRLS